MSSRPSLRTSTAGFTLIELLIVVTVIAILAAFALPSYQQYVRQARRADAIADLLQLQNAVEKCRVNQPTYEKCNETDEVPYPANDYYSFSIKPGTGTSASDWVTSYTVEATAISTKSQAQDEDRRCPDDNKSCTPLTLDQNGTREPACCWKK